VIITDSVGGVYAVTLDEGKELWYTPTPVSILESFLVYGGHPMGSTGGSVVGPNDMIFVGFNVLAGVGSVRALRLEDGSKAWERMFHEEVNTAPAVGYVYGHRRLAVVVAVGHNSQCLPLSLSEWFTMKIRHETGSLDPVLIKTGVIVALDADTGDDIWAYPLEHYWDSYAGVAQDDTCCPAMFGSPAIGGDGTVYVNWSGGRHFALRDANSDGRVDAHDPREVQSIHSGFSTNGITAIAPGLTVFPNCRHMVAYRTPVGA